MMASAPPLDPFLFLSHGSIQSPRSSQTAPFRRDEVPTLVSSTASHPLHPMRSFREEHPLLGSLKPPSFPDTTLAPSAGESGQVHGSPSTLEMLEGRSKRLRWASKPGGVGGLRGISNLA